MKVWRLYMDIPYCGEVTRGVYASREAAQGEIDALNVLRAKAKQRWVEAGSKSPAFWHKEHDDPHELVIEECEVLTAPAYYEVQACMTA